MRASMPSEAAKARAVERGPGFWGFLVAHHWPGQLDRCYRIWIGNKPVWLCSRCLGVYPMLALVLAALLYVRVPVGCWDAGWMFLLPLPAMLDWARSRIAGKPGTNRIRTLTGALLGISLARTVQLNMVHPAHWLVLIQLGAITLVALVVEVLARRRAVQSPAGDGG